jgi:hypothetical protein
MLLHQHELMRFGVACRHGPQQQGGERHRSCALTQRMPHPAGSTVPLGAQPVTLP